MRTLLLASLLAAGSAAAAPPPIGLAKTATPLLADHLAARLPEKARVEARQTSIMAAPESDASETRAVLDAERARFVIFAMELGQLGGPKFDEAAKAYLAKEVPGAKPEPLALAPPLKGFGAGRKPPGKETANLVYTAVVLHPDGSVQRVNFYLSDDAIAAWARWADLGRRVSATLAAGPRTLDLAAGKRSFPGLDKAKLSITVPAGFVASLQQGPDFSVYHLSKMVPLGAEREASCGVYVGGHGEWFHAKREFDPDKVDKIPGTLLGQKTQWRRWWAGAEGCVEARVPYPGSTHTEVHAFCCAPKAEQTLPLRPVLETLTVEK